MELLQFRVSRDGVLSPLTPAGVPGGNIAAEAGRMALSPNGQSLYAISVNRTGLPGGNAVIRQYRITESGQLKSLKPAWVAAGSRPRSIVVTPNGRFAYIVDFGMDLILEYLIQPNGTLSLLTHDYMPILPTPVHEANPVWVAVTPDGRFVYTANVGSNNISQFRIRPNGILTRLTPAVVRTGDSPQSITLDASRHMAYIPCTGRIQRFGIQSNGTLKPLPPAITVSATFHPHVVRLIGRFDTPHPKTGTIPLAKTVGEFSRSTLKIR